MLRSYPSPGKQVKAIYYIVSITEEAKQKYSMYNAVRDTCDIGGICDTMGGPNGACDVRMMMGGPPKGMRDNSNVRKGGDEEQWRHDRND